MDFNPRLREGGDADNSKRLHPLKISIHASAKEATIMTIMSREKYTFQSTPPRRRRPGTPLTGDLDNNFNPRLREGGDTMMAK